MRLFHFIIDSALVGDYVAHIAKQALDAVDDPGSEQPPPKKPTPVDLAKTKPGPRTKALRNQRQQLLEMFFARGVDNFNRYVVDLVRSVLRKQPAILKTRQQSLTLDEILGHASIDDLVHSIIEARVNALSYEGFESLSAWCNDRGIPLKVPGGDHRAIVELLATRNLIAHNRCIVDERYLRITEDGNLKLGQKRGLEVDDLWRCLNLLHGTVLTTDVAAAKKFRLRRTRAKAADAGAEVDVAKEGTAGEA